MRVKRRQIKGLFAWGIFLLFVTQLLGCKMQIVHQEERSEVSFSIISKECIPESLAKLIEERKDEEMKITYVDQGKRYIVIGYGKQNSGGYSIYIKDLYKTENALYVDTCLMGPKEKDQNTGNDILSDDCVKNIGNGLAGGFSIINMIYYYKIIHKRQK